MAIVTALAIIIFFVLTILTLPFMANIARDPRCLAHLVDAGDKSKRDARLIRDADEFKPMRDAMAHTALLTEQAKKRLTTVRENIKARVKALLG